MQGRVKDWYQTTRRERCYLVKVEDQIEFTDIAKEGIQDLDKKVDRLQVGQLVVVGINAQTKEEASIATVDDLEVAELKEHSSFLQ